MTTKKPRVRIVRRLRLVSTVPGFWKIESDPSVLFQFMGKARLGPPGARYSVDRWLAPDGGVSTSLDAAVKRYLAIQGLDRSCVLDGIDELRAAVRWANGQREDSHDNKTAEQILRRFRKERNK